MPSYIGVYPDKLAQLVRNCCFGNDYLIPWAEKIYSRIFDSLRNKKNLIIAGVSFWDADMWELIKYMEMFLSENMDGSIYILQLNKDNECYINAEFEKNSLELDRISYIIGTFSEKYEELYNLL